MVATLRELERPVDKKVDNAGNELPTTPAAIENHTAVGISTNLSKLGHPQTPTQVSAHGEANVVLAKIEDQGVGAKVADASQEAGHLLNRAVENVGRAMSGSSDIYTAPGLPGHTGVMRRMFKKVRQSGIAEKIEHYLSNFRKK